MGEADLGFNNLPKTAYINGYLGTPTVDAANANYANGILNNPNLVGGVDTSSIIGGTPSYVNAGTAASAANVASGAQPFSMFGMSASELGALAQGGAGLLSSLYGIYNSKEMLDIARAQESRAASSYASDVANNAQRSGLKF